MMKRLMQMMLVLAALVPLSRAALAADPPPLPPEPKLMEIARVENGKIVLYMAAPRNSGYGIADSIPVVLVFELTPDPQAAVAVPPVDPTGFLVDTPTAPAAPVARPLAVPQINVSSLSMKILSGKRSEVEMVGRPEIQNYTCGDKQCVRVVFWVTQFVTTKVNQDGTPKIQVSLSVDYLYAVVAQPNGQPDWKTASTPVISVGIHQTAGPNQTIPREGDLSLKVSSTSPLVPYCYGVGIPLMLLLVAEVLWMAYAAYLRPRQLTPEEVFWAEVNPVLADGEKSGFQLDHYQKIIYEFRRKYKVSNLHAFDAVKKLADEPDHEKIIFVFSLEQTFFSKDGRVTLEQHTQLMEALHSLIPEYA
jgi:hypothetical protein